MTKLQITKPRIAQSFEPTRDLRERAKELDRFIDAQLQHLRDIFSPILNIERLAIEAAAAARFAANKCWRQKVHFQLDRASAFAAGATPLLAVEREAAAGIAAQSGLGNLGEQFADFIEEANVSRGRRSRRPSNRRLIDFINRLKTLPA